MTKDMDKKHPTVLGTKDVEKKPTTILGGPKPAGEVEIVKQGRRGG